MLQHLGDLVVEFNIEIMSSNIREVKKNLAESINSDSTVFHCL